MFSCEYCEILRTAFLYRTPLMAGFHLAGVLAVLIVVNQLFFLTFALNSLQSHHENKKSKK